MGSNAAFGGLVGTLGAEMTGWALNRLFASLRTITPLFTNDGFKRAHRYRARLSSQPSTVASVDWWTPLRKPYYGIILTYL